LIDYAAEASGQGIWSCGLDFLGGDLIRESWQVEGPVKAGSDDEIAWRRSGELMFLVLETGDDGRDDPSQRVEQSYTQLLSLADRHGCPWPLRMWNFMPGINRGCGDQERYRRFCFGRARALERCGLPDTALCAGTAIGGDDPVMRVLALCGARPGIQIENPRQVSAYRYPRIYGPASPSFARATAMPQPDGSVLLLVSGTASVVGHGSRHDGDVDGQVEEILENFSHLLAKSAARLGRPGLARIGDGSLLKVYVRHAGHWPRVYQRLVEAWPGSRIAGFRGDICRQDLLVEIEAVVHD
jgi:chorismate lyase/3-hydroxybenzoate synthase